MFVAFYMAALDTLGTPVEVSAIGKELKKLYLINKDHKL